MRLREPFEGYKLSSGHFMFHMAYLLGSKIATKYVLDDPCNNSEDDSRESCFVLDQLNYAHILVPMFTFLSMMCDKKGYSVCEKILEIISIL